MNQNTPNMRHKPSADPALTAAAGSISSSERMFQRDMSKTGNWRDRQEIGTLTLQLRERMEAADTECDDQNWVEMLGSLNEAKQISDKLFRKVGFYLSNK